MSPDDKPSANVMPFERQAQAVEGANSTESYAWLDADFAHITAESMAGAMANFPLPLADGKNMDWLAMAVRRAMALASMGNDGAKRDRRSNAQIRDDLGSLAKQVMALYRDLWSMQADTAAVIDRLFFNEAGGENPFNVERERVLVLYNLLMAASNKAGAVRQRPQWRNAAERDQRVEYGLYIAPVFEFAFRKTVTANDWPSGTARRPSHFMLFYDRAYCLAHHLPIEDDPGVTDLSGMCKKVRKMHEKQPVKYKAAVIPGLPE